MNGPDITEYFSGSGNTLKPHDIDDEMEITITGHRTKTWDDGSKTLYLAIEGDDREFRCNVTNMKRIAEMYGTKVDEWVGKTLSLLPDKTKDRQGKTIDTIIVRVRKARKPAPSRAVDDRNPPPPLDDEIPF